MTDLVIQLEDERMAALTAAARRLGVSPEDLARASIEDWLAKPDEVFGRAASRVLKEHAELYRRLA